MTLRLAADSRSAAADAVVDRLDAGAAPGTIKVYSGSQPATPATAPTGTLLLTFTLNDPAFAAAATGVSALDIAPDLTATGVAAGDAGWFRAADSDGNTVLDGACGLGGSELNLSTLAVSIGLEVTITSGTYTQPQG